MITATYITKTLMLNHIHNNHSHTADDGGQAMGEEFKLVEFSRLIMHTGEKSKQQYKRVMRERAMQ